LDRNCRSRSGMVTGDHLDADAGAVAFRDRRNGFLARRIDEAKAPRGSAAEVWRHRPGSPRC
jgi:hypothetical protein